MKQVRIQRKRTRGWKMPPNTIYVGRGSKWGNPYQAGKDGDGAPAYLVRLYREYLDRLLAADSPARASCLEALAELRGKNLACWCPLDKPCHADVLLELANGDSA